ncbi:PE-PPE domain-containing protein [Mycobacterium sp. CVI_P3]|uniref:PE-PPE domain-containing protein n=1 Tax=Mycobacterium pinniadriaticum TaxID=2994102 RepID=A0ABT3SJA0_9MYCO|nr:PE-PPE domain-containing protein [Mycobacterium pinniadriaticum]MCX2932736.1 PE-PPE domain-containing protein [Mycobacterium pinniadriaticum]MCX2939204.1 PE-PPE domain-containing protein [Mycobacterium pinniadriaticum]
MLPYRLMATEALIMTGSGMPVVEPEWMDLVVRHFINPALGEQVAAGPLTTPEQFWPFSGRDDETIDTSIERGVTILLAALESGRDSNTDLVVFGYSQSAVICSIVMQSLAEAQATGEPVGSVSFVLIGNPTRPNGGLTARFPGLYLADLDWTFAGPMQTDAAYPTADIARQYDPMSDFPLYPQNVLADLNALMGLTVHDYSLVTLDPDDPRYDPNTVVEHNAATNTTYYLIPTEELPILAPLRAMGIAPRLVDVTEPVLRVLIETGYDRTIPSGEPTAARLYEDGDIDTEKLKQDLAAAVEVGIETLKSPASPGSARTASRAGTGSHRPARHGSAPSARNTGTVSKSRPAARSTHRAHSARTM